MDQNLLDPLTIVQIKRSRKDELLQLASDRQINMTAAKTVGEIRERIINEVFGDSPVTEGGSSIPELDVTELTVEQQLAFKKLEFEREQRSLDREREREREGK
jgi:hypothetical protein